jgi:hypothetical protein
MNAVEIVLITFIIICVVQFIFLGKMFNYIEKLRVENYANKARSAIDSALRRSKSE